MGKPIRHRGKWRIRWLDENGQRRSEVYDDYKDAGFKLRQHQQQVEEVRRGLRAPVGPDKSFDELCDYWLGKRAALKRSRKDDESIIRRHLRPVFGGLRVREFELESGVERVDDFVLSRASICPRAVKAAAAAAPTEEMVCHLAASNKFATHMKDKIGCRFDGSTLTCVNQ